MFANHSAKAIEEEDEDSPSDWANSGFSTEDDEGDSFQPKRNNEVLTTGSNAVKKGAKTDQYRYYIYYNANECFLFSYHFIRSSYL